MKRHYFLVLAFFCAVFFSCSDGVEKNGIKIANWNAQTFFDAHNDGSEYSNFLKSEKWGVEAYNARLKKLCEVIKKLDCDIVILEEIENEGILHDISNELAGTNWDAKKIYRYGCFSKKSGSSIGCAILSRYELRNLKNHALNVKLASGKMPSMRPIMEVDVIAKKDGPPLKIFVNHWKSKSGGEEESKFWRQWQEALLAQKIFWAQKTCQNAPIICVGDFNQDISEFCKASAHFFDEKDFAKYMNANSNQNESDKNYAPHEKANMPNTEMFALFDREKIFLYSPWCDFQGSYGSYFFRNEWERIDHFFSCGKIFISEFSPQNSGAWAFEDGTPKSFKLYSLYGYSDHLPIVCRAYF